MFKILRHIFIGLLSVFWGISLGYTTANAQIPEEEIWTPLADGITYREFYLEHPNHIYVARLERNSEHAGLDTSLGNGDFNSGLQTVRGMSALYDQGLNYWGREWGSLNQVVVAINGFFYDTETGIPWSGQVISGWYAKHFDEREKRSGLVWTTERDIFVGECIVHPPDRQIVNFLSTGEKLFFDSINTPKEKDDLVIYTPQFGATTIRDEGSLEILVRLDRPLLIMPSPAMVEGEIIAIQAGDSKTFIPFDHIVLSARGEQREKIEKLARVGEKIGISQELKHYLSDCKTPNPIGWDNVYAATGASFVFLEDGQLQTMQDDLGAILRTPRTAIAYNDRYVFFMVVDGRDRYRSLGMSMVELGLFAKMSLGADWGVAMDGGGSSTMVVFGKVVNHPYTETTSVERAVANGWLMVNIQPAQYSSRFVTGDLVQTEKVSGLELRLGPGDNYPSLTTISPQSEGLILEHELNGVFARGAYWWLVRFGAIQGWVSELEIALK